MPDEYNVKIPKEVYESIKEKLKGTHFKDVNEFIIQHLKQSLKISDISDLGEEEENKIKQRLKSLGYLE